MSSEKQLAYRSLKKQTRLAGSASIINLLSPFITSAFWELRSGEEDFDAVALRHKIKIIDTIVFSKVMTKELWQPTKKEVVFEISVHFALVVFHYVSIFVTHISRTGKKWYRYRSLIYIYRNNLFSLLPYQTFFFLAFMWAQATLPRRPFLFLLVKSIFRKPI